MPNYMKMGSAALGGIRSLFAGERAAIASGEAASTLGRLGVSAMLLAQRGYKVYKAIPGKRKAAVAAMYALTSYDAYKDVSEWLDEAEPADKEAISTGLQQARDLLEHAGIAPRQLDGKVTDVETGKTRDISVDDFLHAQSVYRDAVVAAGGLSRLLAIEAWIALDDDLKLEAMQKGTLR